MPDNKGNAPMPWYIVYTYTVTDPKTGKRWHKPSEMVIANMLFVLWDHRRQQLLGDSDRELLEKIDGSFGFQSRRETAMATLLWELRKEHEQRYRALLSRAATETETLDREGIRLKQIIARIDDAVAISGN